MKVIIAGGREFTDYEMLKRECNNIFKELNISNPIIVSGLARGADSLGLQFAKENEYEYKCFPADWDSYGKSAGYKRNQQMGEYSDILIAFWDNKSRGTKHMIDVMKKLEKNFLLYLIP